MAEINLVKCDYGLALFDCETEYWFDGEEFGKLPTRTASALSNVFAGLRGKDFSRKSLKEWNNAHGVIESGELEGNFFGRHWELDWMQHHFEFTRADTWPQYYQVTISAPTLWQSDLQMKVPYDKLPRVPHPKKEPGFGIVEMNIPCPLNAANPSIESKP